MKIPNVGIMTSPKESRAMRRIGVLFLTITRPLEVHRGYVQRSKKSAVKKANPTTTNWTITKINKAAQKEETKKVKESNNDLPDQHKNRAGLYLEGRPWA